MPKTREEINQQKREHYHKNKEEISQKHKLYYQKNKENFLEYQKQYAIDHKEQIKEYKKQYGIENKERLFEYNKERSKLYNKTENGIKSNNIKRWKNRGLKGDYEMIYRIYLSTKFCDDCGFELNTGNNRMVKCMEHDHKSGLFRGIVCHSCNTKRC
jgi:hypothetical protein